ncbi:MAG: rhomboid family intramembrane serine protease [Chitinophagaceae bacterium]
MKDFRMELIVYGVMWLLSPYIPGKSGQRPMIESMSYSKALLLFGVGFFIALLITYLAKVHRAVLACQTTIKRVVVARVTSMTDTKAVVLRLSDTYLKKIRIPLHVAERFETGDTVRVEVSERGRQLIKISKASETLINRLQHKPETPEATRRPYWSVVFSKDKNEDHGGISFFSFLIPGKNNFISAAILDINILVFILMLISGVSIYDPKPTDIVHWGGNVRMLTIGQGEYWRLLTNFFVHIGIIHLLMNAIGFIFVSIFLEQKLGRAWFLLLYILSGICAGLTSIWWHNNVVSAGASGAIFGLYGYLLASLLFVSRQEREANSGIIGSVLLFVGYNLVMGLKGNIDNAAHIVGLLTGFFTGIILTLSGVGRVKMRNTKAREAENIIEADTGEEDDL